VLRFSLGSWQGEGVIDFDFKIHIVSADVEGGPLRAIIEEIKEKVWRVWFNICFTVSKLPLDLRISAECELRSIPYGKKHIFSELNLYSRL